jgi:hypothetical protein
VEPSGQSSAMQTIRPVAAVIESCQIGLTRNWSFAAFVSDALVVEHAVADGHSDHRYNRLMTILCCE